MTNLGKWDFAYEGRTGPAPYGNSRTYADGATALNDAGCRVVEDWGCGLGWFANVARLITPDMSVVGVDGSHSEHADVIDDLATRETEVSGIFMRHVLEHNYDWPTVLRSALDGFTKRMVLVTFTPFVKTAKDRELLFEPEYRVPVLSLSRKRLEQALDGYEWSESEIESPYTFYGAENFFVIEARE